MDAGCNASVTAASRLRNDRDDSPASGNEHLLAKRRVAFGPGREPDRPPEQRTVDGRDPVLDADAARLRKGPGAAVGTASGLQGGLVEQAARLAPAVEIERR